MPILPLLQKTLGAEVLLLGLGLADDNWHSPNEKFDLDEFRVAKAIVNAGQTLKRFQASTEVTGERVLADARQDAAVRDLPQIQRIQFPVYGRGVSPATSVNHYRFVGMNVPVTCAGVQVNLGGGGFKAQLKRADKSGAAIAVIVGDEEARRGTAAIKSLRAEAPQQECAWAELPARIRALA